MWRLRACGAGSGRARWQKRGSRPWRWACRHEGPKPAAGGDRAWNMDSTVTGSVAEMMAPKVSDARRPSG
eukprot:1886807-Prymnesium_polylepis.1